MSAAIVGTECGAAGLDDGGALMPAGADGDDAGLFSGGQGAMQTGGQREMAKVVGCELQLPPVTGVGFGTGHHTGVVDQDVEWPRPS